MRGWHCLADLQRNAGTSSLTNEETGVQGTEMTFAPLLPSR